MVHSVPGFPGVQDEAPRADVVTYRGSKLMAAFSLLGGLLFAWLGLANLPAHPGAGLLSATFGILIAAVTLAALFSSRPSLRVDGDGFELAGLLGKTKVRWADVEPPRAGSIRGFEAIKVPCIVPQATLFATLGRRQVGMEISVTNFFAASLREILEVMQARYRESHPGIALTPVSFPEDESDISWKTLVAAQLGLLVLYVVVATTVLNQPLLSALRAFATCLGIVGALFILADRTIRWRGPVASSGGPHPRFPTGKHPRPKLQFLIGMALTSGLFLLIFWPWNGRA